MAIRHAAVASVQAERPIRVRIANEAQGGQIPVSSLPKELTESAGDVAFDKGREVELRGLAGRHRLHEVRREEGLMERRSD